MQIGYLVNTYPRASHTFIRREIQALERRGLAVHRFAMRSDRAGLKDAADLAEDARTEHVLEGGPRWLASAVRHLLGHPALGLRGLWVALGMGAAGGGVPGSGGRLRHLIYWLEAAHIARRCRALRLSHLHAHFGTNSASVALLAARMGGPSYSFTVHGPEEFDAPRALSLGAKVAGARFVAAVSSFGVSQLCRWSDLADWPKLAVVPCGIEPWKFPEPSPLPKGGPHLVAIGRLSEQKGLPVLIDAMALAARAHPGLRLALIGDGPLRGAIEARIKAAGLGAVIRLTGWLDEAALKDELARATALVLPSFAEGLPMVVMEAMAAGRPVLATAIAGLPELVVPETGWLVPAGDAAALARAIADIASADPARLTAMGQAARARVLERHDIDTAAERLARLIAERAV